MASLVSLYGLLLLLSLLKDLFLIYSRMVEFSSLSSSLLVGVDSLRF